MRGWVLSSRLGSLHKSKRGSSCSSRGSDWAASFCSAASFLFFFFFSVLKMQSSVGVSVTRASTHPAPPFHSVHWRNEEVRYTRVCLSLEEESGGGRGGENRRNQGMGEEERTGGTRGLKRRREQEEPGDWRGGENRRSWSISAPWKKT